MADSSRVIKDLHRFVAAADACFLFAWRLTRARPRSRYRLSLLLLYVRGMTMHLGPVCDCTLCRIEVRLLDDLAAVEINSFAGVAESSPLRRYLSISDLLSFLWTATAHARSDELLCELLKVRALRPAAIEGLLVVVFAPMLHRTIRRAVKCQSELSEADTTQQALSFLLQFLRSEAMKTRRSHFAFAISRVVKRQVFEWARREGTTKTLLYRDDDQSPRLAVDETFERHAQLRHFLDRCVMKGDLTGGELDLLIQFKLGETAGEDFVNSNGHVSNAVRQRLKRLLAKLRRLAR